MTTSASISYSLQQQQPQYFYAMLSRPIPFVTGFPYVLAGLHPMKFMGIRI